MIHIPHFPGADKLSGTSIRFITTFTCATAFLLFGYDQGVMSSLIEEPMLAASMPEIAKYEPNGAGTALRTAHDVTQVKLQPWLFSDNIQGAVVSCYELGCMIGAIFILFRGDALGRRWCVMIGSTIMIVGTVVMVLYDTMGNFIVGRIVAGLGNGMNTATIPVLQSELSHPRYRGLLVFIEGALLGGGVMISYWLDFAFYFLRWNSVQWRFPIAFQIVFCIVIIIGIMIMPESPRWLVKKNRVEEAESVLARVYGKPRDDPEVQQELHTLVDAIQLNEQRLGPFRYREMLETGPSQNFYRTVLGMGGQCMQQWTGINNLTYYANTVFKMVQPDDIISRILVCCSGVLHFLAASAAVFFIDLIGRRHLMIWGAFGMMLCFAIISGMVYMVQQKPAGDPTTQVYGKVAEAFIYIYFVPWSLGWLGMAWLYPPEVNNMRVRAPAAAMSTIVNWLMNFTVVMISPPAFKSLKNHTFTMFGAFNLLFIPIVYCFYPETKHRGLEEMDLIFEDAYHEGFWRKSRFMTNAAYFSITRPFLSPEELDAVLQHREQEKADGKVPTKPEEINTGNFMYDVDDNEFGDQKRLGAGAGNGTDTGVGMGTGNVDITSPTANPGPQV